MLMEDKRLDAFFTSNGHLNKRLSGFRLREAQQRFAVEVSSALARNETRMVEAETGIGKTLGYAIPIVLSDKRVVISSYTKALQDQIVNEDLKTAIEVAGPHRTVAILKGRDNYVCVEKLKHLGPRAAGQPQLVRDLNLLNAWSYRTKTGDLSEIGTIQPELKAQVTTTAEDCQGRHCSSFDRCPFYRARDRAVSADIVVVNHHLLVASYFSDTALRSAILDREFQLIDEAEHLPEILRSAVMRRFDFSWLKDLIQDLAVANKEVGSQDSVLIDIQQSFADFSKKLSRSGLEMESASTDPAAIRERLVDFLDSAESLLLNLKSILEPRQLQSRLVLKMLLSLTPRVEKIQMLAADIESQSANLWYDFGAEGPVIYAATQSGQGLPRYIDLDSTPKLFVSATLSVAGDFAFFQNQISAAPLLGLSIKGGFDYTQQVLGYRLGSDIAVDHDHFISNLIERVLPVLPSKTLMLFTSFQALTEAEELIRARYSSELFVQGDQAVGDLIERFAGAGAGILMGTRSFWQGIDVKNAGVECLVIDKLPFLSREDPVVSGYAQSLDVTQDWFTSFVLPDCAIRLRQGFGRLIRSEDDRAVFIIGDPRFWHASYADVLQRALPSFQWTQAQSDVQQFLGKV